MCQRGGKKRNGDRAPPHTRSRESERERERERELERAAAFFLLVQYYTCVRRQRCYRVKEREGCPVHGDAKRTGVTEEGSKLASLFDHRPRKRARPRISPFQGCFRAFKLLCSPLHCAKELHISVLCWLQGNNGST